MGEGWHNNHHAYPSSVRQGFRWWEIDPTYYILKALALTGVIRNLKTPPQPVLRNEHAIGSRVVRRAAEQLADHFSSERIAQAIASVLNGPDLAALRDSLSRARDRQAEVLSRLQLPQIPSREELAVKARAIFARTRSLDEIVDRAHELILGSVGSLLIATAES
jgi:stearoyl-CoA desaturase (delta-9 desaturase)